MSLSIILPSLRPLLQTVDLHHGCKISPKNILRYQFMVNQIWDMLLPRMMSLWKFLSGRVPRTSKPNHDNRYDEERLKWRSESWREQRGRCLQPPKLRRTTFFLLLTDLMLVRLLFHAFEPLITLLRRNDELFKSQVSFGSARTSDVRDREDRPNKIPRILHQTTATEAIPDRWVRSQRSCQEAYSGFEYKVSPHCTEPA